ncbi:MAG: hypothetical protein NT103_08365 [Campylobacterales bacterium]|nr:hypothetical protein [Campylobacterales bacterium]
MKMLYLMVLTVVLIFSGCAAKAAPCEPTTITKKCDAKHPVKPKMSPESGDIVQWTKARLENYPKLESIIYDLEAELDKCL